MKRPVLEDSSTCSFTPQGGMGVREGLSFGRLFCWSSDGWDDQFAGPDVTEADGVAVVSKLKAARILPAAFLDRELGHDAVVENGDRAWLDDLSVSALFSRMQMMS